VSAAAWARVQALFEGAVDLDPGQRRAFLDRECDGNAALRDEVEKLLRADAAAGGGAFIDTAIRSAARDITDPGVRTGEQIEGYRLIRELGSGGMGTVWLAERAEGEPVAVKLVQGGIANPEIARRFEKERRILGGLEHPNIAPMLDGGTTASGLPYIVMEFIDGVPLSDWASLRVLDLCGRIELLRTVCDAVQYAHDRHVVHRDLKPSNILVRADGTPKLLDFGIAKLLPTGSGNTEITLSLIRMFTPSYASPEQLLGEEVTAATDVFALGVLLYELVTGVHPFAGDNPAPFELRRRILEEVPDAPSAAVVPGWPVAPALLKGDIDYIALRAMERDPLRRYVSAFELQEDLRRYLLG
jgi:serine/threonine protein kinase